MVEGLETGEGCGEELWARDLSTFYSVQQIAFTGVHYRFQFWASRPYSPFLTVLGNIFIHLMMGSPKPA